MHQIAPSGFREEGPPYPAFEWVTDNVTVNQNITLGEFPLGIAHADWGSQGYHPQAAIGVGSKFDNTEYSACRGSHSVTIMGYLLGSNRRNGKHPVGRKFYFGRL